MHRRLPLVPLLICFLIHHSGAFAQVTNNNTRSALPGQSSATTGSTTEGIQGETTEGIAQSSSDTGGVAGSNIPQEFVGAPSSDEFVGSQREATRDTSVERFFRAITGQEVPTGGTQDSSGEPRRVPVSLKLGFKKPAAQELTALAGETPISFLPYLEARPELGRVAARMDDAGLVTLTGSVPDASTRRLAANLLRFQPGVRRVQNQLDVAAPADN